MIKHRRALWLIPVLAAFMLLAVAPGAVAAGRKYWCILPIVTESGAQAPSWLGYALEGALGHGLDDIPSAERISWQNARRYFYINDGVLPPENAWSADELASIAKRCGVDAVIAARCALSGGVISLHWRVWTPNGTRESTITTDLSSAGTRLCDAVKDLASAMGFGQPAALECPIVANGKSLEYLGRVGEATTTKGYADAVPLAKEWTQYDSITTTALYFQALVLYHDSSREFAAHIEPLTIREPTSPKLWRELAWAKQASEPSSAEQAYQHCLTLDQHDPLTLLDLARYASRSGRADEANRLEASAVAEATSWLALFQMGRYSYEQGEYGDAEQYLRRAQQAGGTSCSILNYLGNALYSQERTQEAIEIWKTSARACPSPQILSNIGRAYMYLGKWDESAKYLTLALNENRRCIKELRLSPRGIDRAHSSLAYVYHHSGQPLLATYHMFMSTDALRKLAVWALAILCALVFGGVAIAVVMIRKRLAPDGPKKQKSSG